MLCLIIYYYHYFTVPDLAIGSSFKLVPMPFSHGIIIILELSCFLASQDIPGLHSIFPSPDLERSPGFFLLQSGIQKQVLGTAAAAAVASVVSDSVRPHRQQPNRLPRPWDSPGKDTGVGCHFLLQCLKVKSESEVAQSCLTPSDPMGCSPPGSSIHGIFQARVLEWGAIAFSGRVATKFLEMEL